LGSLCRVGDLIRQIDLLIADLRRADCQRVPGGGDWSRDLQTILDAYDARLRATGGTDIECAPALFAQHCQRLRQWPATVVLDGLLTLPPVLGQALRALGERVPQTIITLVAPGL